MIFAIPLQILSVEEAWAYEDTRDTQRLAHQIPSEIEGVGIDQKLGDQIDLNTQFIDDSGKPVALGRFFNGVKPVIISVVYYDCPSLCNYHLNGLTETLKKLQWTVGQQFEVVAITMNYREDYPLAAAKKANYIKSYGRPESVNGWHFLTGTDSNIQKVTNQLGFGFKWIEATQQYAHASAAIILTPGGQISRYLSGLVFTEKDLKLSLLEASGGKIGSIVDQIVMFCFQFDPSKNKYTLYAFNLMRIAALLMVAVMLIFLTPIWLRERKLNMIAKGDNKV